MAPDENQEPAPEDVDRPSPSRRRYRFPRTHRVTRRSDFERVMRTGLRVADGRLAMWGVLNGLRITRLGVTVGRRHGGAVERNRVKRLVREAFRLCQHDLPAGLDLVCSPHGSGPVGLSDCHESLIRLADRLVRRLAKG